MALRGVQKPGEASPTEPGLVEFATDAETIAGTATDKATTPANIQAKVASDTAKGIVELLTDAEAVAGTDATRAATATNMVAKMSAPGPIGDTAPAAASFTEIAISTTGKLNLGAASFIYESTSGTIKITDNWQMSSLRFGAIATTRPQLLQENSSATNPVVLPNGGTTDTGTGGVAGAVSTITGGVERLTADASGNILLNGSPAPSANGGKVMVYGDNAADPTMGANTGGIYGKDIAGTVEMFAVDEAGNAAQLTPHPADKMAATDINEPVPWFYSALNTYLGKKVTVDMSKVIRLLEGLTGETLIQVEDIPKQDWDAVQEQQRVEHDRLGAEQDERKAKALVDKEPFDEPITGTFTKKQMPKWMKDRLA